jgi:hypothetical protein
MISGGSPSCASVASHVAPIAAASRAFAAGVVSTAMRHGIVPWGEGAHRAASITCSKSARGTGSGRNARTLRRPGNSPSTA